MERGEQRWREVVAAAQDYLRRFRDPMTCALRDEIAQDAAVLAWQWVGRLDRTSRLLAAVRTITRRQRLRKLRQCKDRGPLQLVPFGDDGVDDPIARVPDEASLRIGARTVPLGWAVHRLDRVLDRLPELDQHLLLGFHEGFCCAELAHRFGRTEACVKTRIHRARRRVQRLLEGLVRGAAGFDDREEEEGRR